MTQASKQRKNKLFSILKFCFALILFIIVIYSLYNELKHIDPKDVILTFSKTDRMSLITLFFSGGAAVILLSLYDVALTKILKLNISIWRTLRVGYIINAFNALIGFSGFIGASARFLIYKQYTTRYKELIHTISIILLSMLTGLSLLSILVVCHVFNVSHVFTPFPWIHWLLYLVALFLPIFVIITIIKPVQGNNKFAGIYCTIISSLEWMAASGVLFMAMKVVNIDTHYSTYMGIFIIASLSGLISFIPGGLGAFDLVMLLGLKAIGVDEDKVVLALLLYRFAYYFFPVLVALILSIFEFGGSAKKYLEESDRLMPAREITAFLMSFQKDVKQRIPALSMSLLLIFTSIFFFINNVNIIDDGLYSKDHSFYYILVAIHTTACLLILLNILGVFALSKRAILFEIVSIILIIGVTFWTYASYISLLWLIVILILLIVLYRSALVLKRPLRVGKLIGSIIVSGLALYLNHVWIAHFFYTLDMYHIEANTSLLRYYFWITLFFVIIIVGAIVWYFERKTTLPHDQESLSQCEAIIDQYGGHYLSHLIYSGDKDFYLSEAEDAFIMYKQKHNAYIVLGDPIGNPQSYYDMLEQFYQHAYYLGYDVIFYQVTDRYLSLYHSFGNQFFKLGEEAIIDLTQFAMSGKKNRGLRATMNKFKDLNMTFEVVEPPFNTEFVEALRHISDEWLDGRKEMAFSVGSFDEFYLSQAPIAVIRDAEDEIIAFCNLMPTYYEDTLSVDLIRWGSDTDLPLMDVLYLNILLWAQEQGYRHFNMGMATLSNVGQASFAFTGEKIAGRVFEHFNGLYRFQGLRRYKEKFKPSWKPRFIVYRKHNSLWLSMIRVVRAIRK
ncbi:bifunctional lysylphosphatidylglycerol flippase/synthetase MprF [Staphylococcus pettenkoferi]|uniref:Phosphatidylglycerol lysyltransferase n=1 Tax=Staphylococcus pettenkoferi TaxID=170573 RepID=A0A9Q4D7R8_9STAP|nr:bifunctional lysylphosphatidylglycerol flippase/synthetase MprF [Staphylococcus pettenkoferi]MCY1568191.1 bifunctional lysylphosphatidylglycerol flippase/synthetase MprF [Staphylococcus pettenkoferi]MCY1594922.1 bifunctional lysylphosphatidylglycerol flippase/synthetase MprF [Staphylococcus pettenkoferi]